ncbi:MAG: patatin-like phospholipase family protein [Candidatus Cloacimonetes bacterium]|nr:patatin-like phospholipase family protein [Candidatus Cloacimonadota bacterium]
MKSLEIRHSLFICFLLLIFACKAAELSRPKVGLVLSGGGAKGLAHIGVLKVIEETGLPIDYITGTSMGSIVGGLYAIGYRAADLEKLVLEQNWDDLIFDKISRRNISFEEKNDLGRYIASFPIDKGRVSLPAGLVAGQKISMLLADLTMSAHHIEDFNQLPIPFRCIATDIEKGEAVILDHGSLSEAIRASLSIPSAFTPIELEGQLLVDGGLIRNFPVTDVIDMGAELVIGVDVGTPLYSKKELNTLTRIMNQSIGLLGAEDTRKQRKRCDILIEPEVEKYNLMSFNDAAALIEQGEIAARKMLPEMELLASHLANFPRQPDLIPRTIIDSVYVKEIYIQGLRNVSRNLVYGKLKISRNSWLTPDQIFFAIERVYGSGFFESATYKLEPVADGVQLFIRVIEKTTDLLRFGLHYDSDMKSSLLANACFRNLLIQGSKLDLNLRISEFEGWESSYFIHTGWKPGFALGYAYLHDNFEIFLYDHESMLMATYDYSNSVNQIELLTIFSNSFALGGSIQLENTRIKPILTPYSSEEIDENYEYLNFVGHADFDSYDRTYFARKGVKLSGQVKLTYNISKTLDEYSPVKSYSLRYNEILEISDRFSLSGGFTAAKVSGKDIPPDYYVYLGGLLELRKGLYPLLGHKFMSVMTTNALIFTSSLQWEVFKEKYITFRADYARTGELLEELYRGNNSYYGLGITLGISTPVGPLEYTMMINPDNKKDKGSSFINFGYRF